MKKFLAVLGGIVAASSILAIAVVILKKIKLSFSIECADETFDFDENTDDGVSISIEGEEKNEGISDEEEFFSEDI